MTTPEGPWRRLWSGRARRRAREAAAYRLYAGLVAQARRPAFYDGLGVPDTPDGRLEMIGLHAALVMRRLRGLGGEGRDLAQALFDLMFADVDRNLREQGVGDLSVGKHVKRAARTFLARAQGLDAALDSPVPRAALAGLLARNLFTSGATPPPGRVEGLARYVEGLAAALLDHDAEGLLAGRLDVGGGPPIIDVDSSNPRS
ncbi:MAG: ubiquinol-cytochrome C chaperone family protein [Geminicoccaceae bacterium]|nr:ubiquinol-cytochrome C chaperone family protein [Geminicoccaceae bacterium]